MENAGRLKQVGAVGGNRTPDLTLTKRLLYQLSYNGVKRELNCNAGAHFITSTTNGAQRR
jgi:hypothetical protein